MKYIPKIETIDDVEMIRDGGSWYVTVSDVNDCVYTLFSKVEVDTVSSEKWIRVKYHKPILTNKLSGNKGEIDFYEAFEMLDEGKICFDDKIRLKWFLDAKKLFQSNGEIFDSIRYVGD